MACQNIAVFFKCSLNATLFPLFLLLNRHVLLLFCFQCLLNGRFVTIVDLRHLNTAHRLRQLPVSARMVRG